MTPEETAFLASRAGFVAGTVSEATMMAALRAYAATPAGRSQFSGLLGWSTGAVLSGPAAPVVVEPSEGDWAAFLEPLGLYPQPVHGERQSALAPHGIQGHPPGSGAPTAAALSSGREAPKAAQAEFDDAAWEHFNSTLLHR